MHFQCFCIGGNCKGEMWCDSWRQKLSHTKHYIASTNNSILYFLTLLLPHEPSKVHLSPQCSKVHPYSHKICGKAFMVWNVGVSMSNHDIEHLLFCGNPTYMAKARFVLGTRCMLPKFDILTYDTKKMKCLVFAYDDCDTSKHITLTLIPHGKQQHCTWFSNTRHTQHQHLWHFTICHSTTWGLITILLPNDNGNDIIKSPHLETWTLKLLVRHILDSFDESWESVMFGVGGPSTKRNGYLLYTWATLLVLVMMLKHVDGVYHDQCKMHVIMHHRDISNWPIRYHLSWV